MQQTTVFNLFVFSEKIMKEDKLMIFLRSGLIKKSNEIKIFISLDFCD